MNLIVHVRTLVRVVLFGLVALVGFSAARGRHARTTAVPAAGSPAVALVVEEVAPPVPAPTALPASAARTRPYVPVPFTPIPPAPPVRPRATMVRPYLLAHEHRRHQERLDRSRLGMAVLLDISRQAQASGVLR